MPANVFPALHTASPRDLVRFPLATCCIYYDPPSIIDDDQLRVSVRVPVPVEICIPVRVAGA